MASQSMCAAPMRNRRADHCPFARTRFEMPGAGNSTHYDWLRVAFVLTCWRILLPEVLPLFFVRLEVERILAHVAANFADPGRLLPVPWYFDGYLRHIEKLELLLV